LRGKFVSYLRVSTDKQGENGYGIEAQRQAVATFLNGGSWQLVGEFVEVESGRRKDRPKLAEAIAACKKHRARLVIGKLDRLARNVHLISGLMEAKVDFVCCDMPDANRLTIHILAAVAEHERRQASALGRAQAIAPVLHSLAGMSARAAAAELNARQVETPSGAPWSAKTVIRARERVACSLDTGGPAREVGR
jgi:hypothetical protein